MKFNCDDIIYALATPFAECALAIIRVSGRNCISTFAPHFSGKIEKASSSTAVYGKLEEIDNCMVTVYKDGHGYTGEESFEISCHGGLETIREVLSFLSSIGYRQAEGGEFTLRAFMHGKLDLTRAEAVNELVNSQSQKAKNSSLSRLNGSLFKKIDSIKQILVKVMGLVEVQLDYAEDEISDDVTFPVEDVENVIKELKTLSLSYNAGKLYSEGARVVLCGKANAGKSSLFNWFLKEDRAIVSPVEGTTRDFIEALCSFDGIPVKLYDTAGLRESSDSIELEGIKRTKNLIDSADIIIYLADSSAPYFDKQLAEDNRTVCVLSKSDIVNVKKDNFINISVETGEGIDALIKTVSEKLKKGCNALDESSLVIQSERQKEDLDRAIEALENALSDEKAGLPLDIVTLTLQEALQALGEITGEVTTDNILDRIFADFCVGK